MSVISIKKNYLNKIKLIKKYNKSINVFDEHGVEKNKLFEEMIKRKNTETLGYRGLMEQNLNQQDFHHAFIYGEKLFNLNPKID